MLPCKLVLLVHSLSVKSIMQNLALPLLAQTQSIAPLLIIYRVAQGRAWSHETLNATHTGRIRFRGRRRVSTTQGASTLPMAFAPMQAASMVTDARSASTADLHAISKEKSQVLHDSLEAL